MDKIMKIGVYQSRMRFLAQFARYIVVVTEPTAQFNHHALAYFGMN